MAIQQTQDYYKQALETLDFVKDEEMAEEVVKGVLGVLTSKLSEQEAKEFTAQLPDYLSYENLRGHQANPSPTTAGETIDILSDHFKIDNEQANEAFQQVIGVAKEQASGEISDIAAELSNDWREAIDKA
ncbi:DUF2267 domain-containing protein [Gracilimonas sp. Q87]|uniref:DUF2267 domain-containing protein n=1 Tax=Gracilimonas sp. Q87 TaxID=3384766 RepID=UPI00398429AF